jgi:hypothetical protein
MSLNLELFSTMIPEPYGLGPGTYVTSYLNPRELRLTRGLNQNYYEYCDEYIRKYISLMGQLYYGLFVEPPEFQPQNQMGIEDWINHTNNYEYFNTIIGNNNTTKDAFYQQYVEIFKEMFNFQNIDEFRFSNMNNLLNRCNPERVSNVENRYNVKLEYLINIVEQANQLSTDSLS